MRKKLSTDLYLIFQKINLIINNKRSIIKNKKIKNMTKEELINKKAKEVVDNHIICNLCLTMEKELNENPDLLLEAENYKEDEETEEHPEIYEFWAVDDWLYDELKDAGEVVFEDLDFNVWGRQATGQAIYMDYVIQGIAESLIK